MSLAAIPAAILFLLALACFVATLFPTPFKSGDLVTFGWISWLLGIGLEVGRATWKIRRGGQDERVLDRWL